MFTRVVTADVAAVRPSGEVRRDPSWIHRDGRTMTTLERDRTLAHLAAWAEVATGDGPALVIEPDATRAERFDVLVAELGEALDPGDWDLALLAGARTGHPAEHAPAAAGYVLTAAGAAALLAIVPALQGALVPIEEVLAALLGEQPHPGIAGLVADVDLAALRVDPALIHASARRPLRPVSPSPDAAVGERAEAWPPVWDDLLVCVDHVPASHPGSALALLLPSDGAAVLLGGSIAALASYARLGGSGVVSDPEGTAWFGPVAALRATPLTADLVDDTGVLFAPTDDVVLLGGRPRDVLRDTDPAVVVGRPGAVRALAHAATADPSRDLVRLLRYDGAADPDVWVRSPAPEILTVPFWTPEFCATVIRAAEAVGAWTPHEDDPFPGQEVSLASISPRLYAHVEDHVFTTVVPLLKRQWPTIDFHGFRDAFVIKYAATGQQELALHHDTAQISAAARLTDRFEGGLLEFPRQGWDNRDVPVGTLTVWPSLVTHPHRSTPVTAGVKYGITIWFEIPDFGTTT